jgi:hypothetical protein
MRRSARPAGGGAPYPTVLGRPAPDAQAHYSLDPVSRSPLGALGEHPAAVRASRTNGFTLIGSASRDPGHSLLTRERRPARDQGQGGEVMSISRGEVSPSTPSVSLGVPGVSRLRPVEGLLSKAREEQDFPAQSRPTERMFGRGRQSANPRITGGLVSSDQAERFAASDVGAPNASTGSKRAANGPARGRDRRLTPQA